MNPADQPKSPSTIGLPPAQFAAAFPFHFALDQQLRLLQTGSSLLRICPDLKPGVSLAEVFEPFRPKGQIALDWVRKNIDHFFLLEHRVSKLLLRGQFMLLPETDTILFLGSPWLTDSSEIVKLV